MRGHCSHGAPSKGSKKGHAGSQGCSPFLGPWEPLALAASNQGTSEHRAGTYSDFPGSLAGSSFGRRMDDLPIFLRQTRKTHAIIGTCSGLPCLPSSKPVKVKGTSRKQPQSTPTPQVTAGDTYRPGHPTEQRPGNRRHGHLTTAGYIGHQASGRPQPRFK